MELNTALDGLELANESHGLSLLGPADYASADLAESLSGVLLLQSPNNSDAYDLSVALDQKLLPTTSDGGGIAQCVRLDCTQSCMFKAISVVGLEKLIATSRRAKALSDAVFQFEKPHGAPRQSSRWRGEGGGAVRKARNLAILKPGPTATGAAIPHRDTRPRFASLGSGLHKLAPESAGPRFIRQAESGLSIDRLNAPLDIFFSLVEAQTAQEEFVCAVAIVLRPFCCWAAVSFLKLRYR
jgi:hypothetical protein